MDQSSQKTEKILQSFSPRFRSEIIPCHIALFMAHFSAFHAELAMNPRLLSERAMIFLKKPPEIITLIPLGDSIAERPKQNMRQKSRTFESS